MLLIFHIDYVAHSFQFRAIERIERSIDRSMDGQFDVYNMLLARLLKLSFTPSRSVWNIKFVGQIDGILESTIITINEKNWKIPHPQNFQNFISNASQIRSDGINSQIWWAGKNKK